MSAQNKKKSKKPIPKTTKKPKNRANSRRASTNKVKAWIADDIRLKDQGLKPTTDPVKNYYCGYCDVFRGASCKNDMIKHVNAKKPDSAHQRNKRDIDEKREKDKQKENEPNEPNTSNQNNQNDQPRRRIHSINPIRRSIQISGVTQQIQDLKYDFYHASLSSNIPAHQIIRFTSKFLIKKRRIQYSSYLPKSDAKFTQDMPNVLLEYKKRIKDKMGVFAARDPFFHFSTLMDEGTNNGDALMAVLTALNATDKPTFTHGALILNSSNSVAVCDAYMENLEFLNFNRKSAVLLLDMFEYAYT